MIGECPCGMENPNDVPCVCGEDSCPDCTHICEWCGREGCEACMICTTDGWVCAEGECAECLSIYQDLIDIYWDIRIEIRKTHI